MTTISGRSRAACSSRIPVERWAASATTWKRSGSPSSTSTACVPIDPVDPNRLTERIDSAEVEGFDHEVRGGEDEEEPVDPIQDAAMARHEPTHVLDPEIALDHRLAQIPERSHDRHHDPE